MRIRYSVPFAIRASIDSALSIGLMLLYSTMVRCNYSCSSDDTPPRSDWNAQHAEDCTYQYTVVARARVASAGTWQVPLSLRQTPWLRLDEVPAHTREIITAESREWGAARATSRWYITQAKG